MGAATAWRLSKRGVDVVCYDSHSPPHTYGSSHGESRIIRSAYFEGAWYVPLLREVFPLWRELERATGAQLLTMTGALILGSRSSEAVSGTLASARAHDLEVQLLDAAEMRRRYPGHILGDEEIGVLDTQAGFLRPEAALSAMLSLVPNVVRGTTVTSLTKTLEKFDYVVVAAGSWTPELLHFLPLRVERQVMAWFEIEKDATWLTPDNFPVFIHPTAQLGDIYGLPTLDGHSMKIARHHDGEVTDPDHIRREVDDSELDPLRTFASRYLRGATTTVTKTATCMYTNTPDGHFVIDFHPDLERVVVISACSGHGFKFAPVIGDIAADLICEGDTRRDISRFRLSRFASGDLANTRPQR